jgi:hypothetical protein
VPFGLIDLNYLLNNFHASSTGAIGVPEKAICEGLHQYYSVPMFTRQAPLSATASGRLPPLAA